MKSLLAAIAISTVALAQPAFAGQDCKCRANGHMYEQGQIMCILGKLAQCQMNQNVSAWQVIADVCPEAELSTPRPRAQSIAQLIR